MAHKMSFCMYRDDTKLSPLAPIDLFHPQTGTVTSLLCVLCCFWCGLCCFLVLQAVKFTDKNAPGLSLALDEEFQAADCFSELARGYFFVAGAIVFRLVTTLEASLRTSGESNHHR